MITDLAVLKVLQGSGFTDEFIQRFVKILIDSRIDTSVNAFQVSKVKYLCDFMSVNWDVTFGKYIYVRI